MNKKKNKEYEKLFKNLKKTKHSVNSFAKMISLIDDKDFIEYIDNKIKELEEEE